MANKCLVRHFYLFEAILCWQCLQVGNYFLTLYLQPLHSQPIYKFFEAITFTWSEIWRNMYMQYASTCALFSPFKFLIILPYVPLFFPASVVRHIYLRPGVGVGALQKVYGGKHSKHADRVIHTPCVVCTSIAGNLWALPRCFVTSSKPIPKAMDKV